MSEPLQLKAIGQRLVVVVLPIVALTWWWVRYIGSGHPLLYIFVAASLAFTLGGGWRVTPLVKLDQAFRAGNLSTMLELLPLLRQTPVIDVNAWNYVVNGFIWSGRYHEAIRSRKLFGGRLRRAKASFPEFYGLSLLNVAEALYNLGRWKLAYRLMQQLFATGSLKHGVNYAGGRAQLAWIDAHFGKGDEALKWLATADESMLPAEYQAEFHFTYAVAHLANGDIARARESLAVAHKRVIRPPSKRNILFLEARCAFAEADYPMAIALCEEAANHAYKGQGGDGLLLWGDACEKLGDSAAAARAWQLAIERDCESESAMLARQRLESAARKSA